MAKVWFCAILSIGLSVLSTLPLTAQEDVSGGVAAESPEKGKAAFPEGAIALIGGEPLFLDEVKDMCYERHGLGVIQGLVNTKVIRAEAAARKIKVKEEEVTDRYIEEISSFATANNIKDPGEPFKDYLRSRLGMTVSTYRHGLETQILLRKLLESDKDFRRPRISREDIENAFEGMYGAKYHLQLISVMEKSKAQEVQKELEAGADFAGLSVKYSVSDALRAYRGTLRPLSNADLESSFGADNAALIRNLKQGEHTAPFFYGGGWHIAKLVLVEPAAKSKMDKETEERIRKDIYRVQIEDKMKLYLGGLVQQYNVRLNDALLPEVAKRE
jgi:parvulin-like peptidyl-prolyl isomerase